MDAPDRLIVGIHSAEQFQERENFIDSYIYICCANDPTSCAHSGPLKLRYAPEGVKAQRRDLLALTSKTQINLLKTSRWAIFRISTIIKLLGRADYTVVSRNFERSL